MLVGQVDTVYFACEFYCNYIGKDCAGAWEDKNNDCEILNTESCFHNFGSYTHDAICQCKSEGLFTFKNLSSQEVTITF